MNLTHEYTHNKLQREKPLKQLQNSYDELYKQHSKTEEKLVKTLKDLKELKSRNEQLERELNKKQRSIEDLIDEKASISAKLNENREKSRKLESKIIVGGNKNEIVNKQIIQSLKNDKKELEVELDQAFSKIEELEDHIKVISRALELKLEKKTEAEQIAVLQVAEQMESVERLKDKEKVWKIKFEELRAENEELASEKETLKKHNEYLLSLNSELESKLKAVETSSKDLKGRFESISKEHKSLLEYIDDLSSQKASVSHIHKQTKQTLEAKQLQLEELQLKYTNLESQIVSDKSQKSVKFNLSDVHNSSNYEEVIQENHEEILNLKRRISELELVQGDLDLKDNYEKALLDLEELKDEKEQLKQAMNEAINQCAISLVKQQTLEKENQKLQKQVENLANSKLSMQNTLADQINSLRSQVQRLKEERNDQSIRLSV